MVAAEGDTFFVHFFNFDERLLKSYEILIIIIKKNKLFKLKEGKNNNFCIYYEVYNIISYIGGFEEEY